MRHQVALATAVLLSCLGAGCASTQAVRDSSTNTAQLMRQVGPEVDRFRTASQAGDADIAATLAAARLKDEAARIWLNEQVRFDNAAGNRQNPSPQDVIQLVDHPRRIAPIGDAGGQLPADVHLALGLRQ